MFGCQRGCLAGCRDSLSTTAHPPSSPPSPPPPRARARTHHSQFLMYMDGCRWAVGRGAAHPVPVDTGHLLLRRQMQDARADQAKVQGVRRPRPGPSFRSRTGHAAPFSLHLSLSCSALAAAPPRAGRSNLQDDGDAVSWRGTSTRMADGLKPSTLSLLKSTTPGPAHPNEDARQAGSVITPLRLSITR